MTARIRVYRRMAAATLCGALLAGCSASKPQLESLEQRLHTVVNEVPGTVGIAYVSDRDTVTVNNGVRYALMSVFKLHESLAVCNALESSGARIDSVLHITEKELDRETWSPMMKTYTSEEFDIPIRRLIEYAIVSSDNNASNIMFRRIVSPAATDRFVKSVATDTTFSISHSEGEMKANHDLSYRNYTSPLAAALLIRQVFKDSLVSTGNQEAIRRALSTATIGHNRLAAPFAGRKDVLFAHKTGSGYRNANGELIAFNDVAYVRLPDGRDYSVAVFIRDFCGTEEEAAKVMAQISEIIYSYLNP